jgi:hypothetical protein
MKGILEDLVSGDKVVPERMAPELVRQVQRQVSQDQRGSTGFAKFHCQLPQQDRADGFDGSNLGTVDYDRARGEGRCAQPTPEETYGQEVQAGPDVVGECRRDGLPGERCGGLRSSHGIEGGSRIGRYNEQLVTVRSHLNPGGWRS